MRLGKRIAIAGALASAAYRAGKPIHAAGWLKLATGLRLAARQRRLAYMHKYRAEHPGDDSARQANAERMRLYRAEHPKSGQTDAERAYHRAYMARFRASKKAQHAGQA